MLYLKVALSVGHLEPPSQMESAWQAIIVRQE